MTRTRSCPSWLRRQLSKPRLKEVGCTCCTDCRKIAWPTFEAANAKVGEMKEHPSTRTPHLLEAYRCPSGKGWHVGHNYVL
jgi:hypothetical protein